MLKQIARDGSIYAVGTIVSRGLALLTVPSYTHFLDPAGFGALDLILTAGVLLTLVIALEVGQGLAREWTTLPDTKSQRKMAGTALCFTALMHGSFLALALPFSASLSEVLFHTADRSSLVEAGLTYIAWNALYLQLQAQFRWSMQPLGYVTTSVMYGLMTLILGFYLGRQWGVTGVLIGQTLAAASAVGVSLWVLRTQFDWTLNLKHLRSMLAYSLPLAPAGLATFASFHANRFILNLYTNLDQVGQYAVASKVAAITALLTVGIQTALTPLIYRHHAAPQTPNQLVRLLEGFTTAALTLSLGLSLYAQELILWFSGPMYLPSTVLVAWLIPATLLSQMYIFFPGLALARRTVIQLMITVLCGFVALCLNFILIPIAQSQGAAVSTLITAILYIGIWARESQKTYQLPIRTGRIALAVSTYIFLIGASSIIQSFEFNQNLIILAKFFLLTIMATVCSSLGLFRIHRRR
ncbi:oligosaccharide flippase family protein [Paenacidovorax monticola]|uniref:Oligosaccharide flippase family protein n=1 Tax=Paenacidovorax monticola TaxID=1926868 RepID=A0A7H0HK94_9BURK|nr:oligosaccharide flippase family protein [Paenacidovorax monticola]QNP60960.1 oligosaccharide flippase family protein [Paenacidovorax monticola]